MSEPNINQDATDSETRPPEGQSEHDPEQNKEAATERISGFFPASAERFPLAEEPSDKLHEDLQEDSDGEFLESWGQSESQPEQLEKSAAEPGLWQSLRSSILGLLALMVGVSLIGSFNSRQAVPPLEPEAEPVATSSISPEELYDSDIFPELKQQALLSESLTEASVDPIEVSEAEPVHAEIVGKDVNLRARPTQQASVVKQAQAGESYLLTGRLQTAEDLNWVELKVKEDQLAWVSEKALKIDLSLLSATAEATPEPRGSSAADKLLLEDGFAWLSSPEEVRLVTGKALLSEIFKAEPDKISLENLVQLNACLTASAKEDDLTELKVYELASACALAMKWR